MGLIEAKIAPPLSLSRQCHIPTFRIHSGDFGCLQRLNWDETGDIISPTNRLDVTGTVAYRAPELLKGCPPSLQADIYAYGVLVWQMLSQKHPYSGRVRLSLLSVI